MNETATKPPVTGIIQGLSNADYHADKSSYSSTLIKKMAIPAEARYAMENPGEYKESYRIGAACHAFILEPDVFKKEFKIAPKIARRSGADKMAWISFFIDNGWCEAEEFVYSNKAAEWNPAFTAATGINFVDKEEIERINLMAKSMQSNPNAMRLLQNSVSEASVYWTDESGLNLRCRPDALSDSFITDLKTAERLDDYAVDRSIANFGYDLQDAMYTHGCQVASGKYRPFTFIFAQPKPPFMVRVIVLNEYAKEKGWDKYQANKARLKECLDSGVWAPLPDDLDHELFARKGD